MKTFLLRMLACTRCLKHDTGFAFSLNWEGEKRVASFRERMGTQRQPRWAQSTRGLEHPTRSVLVAQGQQDEWGHRGDLNLVQSEAKAISH